ncbi:MAG TPA: hypothetical protein PK209_12900 [Saprospiraceae bacterium]|nr:hypothetical protein [Saprospiraceae bacterium]
MELENLKSAWVSLDKKLEKSALFNDQLIDFIVNNQSLNTIEKMKKQNQWLFLILIVELLALGAILVGNPFDFNYAVQYLPFAFLTIIIFIAAVRLYTFQKRMNADLASHPLLTAIQNLLNYFKENKSAERWFGIISLSIGFLVPWSFLPQKIERYGVVRGILDIVIMLSVTAVIYFLAFRFGAFKNRNKEKLEQYLREWNELKALSNQINNV